MSFSFSPTADKILGGLLTRGQGHLIESIHTQQTVLTGSGQTTLPIMHLSSWATLVLLLMPRMKKRSEPANQLKITFRQLKKNQQQNSLKFTVHHLFFLTNSVLRSRPVRVIVVLLIDAFTIILTTVLHFSYYYIWGPVWDYNLKPAMSVSFKPEAHNPVYHERTASYDPCDGFPLYTDRFKYGVSFYYWST